MNALAVISNTERDTWLETGRSLAQQRRDVDWRIGDWLVEGKEAGFVTQGEFDFLSDQLGLAPKRLKAAVNAASHFPPATRDETLSVEHHVHVAALPGPDALSILKQAKEAHWTPEETRVEAIKRKVEIGQTTLLTDDDWAQHMLVDICRRWNRATPDVRREFLEMAEEANLGIIDA